MIHDRPLTPAQARQAIILIESQRRGNNNFYVLNVRYRNKKIQADIVVGDERYNEQGYTLEECLKFIDA